MSGAGSHDHVERHAHDAVYIDAVVSVDILHIAGLAKLPHAEIATLDLIYTGKKGQSVWMTV